MGRIDAHCHFWNPARRDYGWLDRAGPSLQRVFAPSDLAALNGGSRVVAVQAAPTEAETDYLLGLDHPMIAGVVGWVDMTDPQAVAWLETRVANPAFKGIRPMLQDIPDADWIVTAPHRDVLAALPRLGLRFDALVLPRHLSALARFADENPDLPIVIDHAAKPLLADGATNGGDGGWAAGMARLAANPRVQCKLSGLLTEMSPAQCESPDAALAVLRPVLDRLLEWFGADRILWGSDWPVLTLAAPYGDWESLTDTLLAPLCADEQAAIRGGNAARFYKIGGSHG